MNIYTWLCNVYDWKNIDKIMWYTTEKCYTNVINENNLANCMLFGTIIAKFFLYYKQ